MINLSASNQNTHYDNFKKVLSSIPIFGNVINWAFKVLTLPSRFYSLQQDFSNRAAWIDYSAQSQLKQVQESISCLDLRIGEVFSLLNAIEYQGTQNREQFLQEQLLFENQYSQALAGISGLDRKLQALESTVNTAPERWLQLEQDLIGQLNKFKNHLIINLQSIDTRFQNDSINALLNKECNAPILFESGSDEIDINQLTSRINIEVANRYKTSTYKENGQVETSQPDIETRELNWFKTKVEKEFTKISNELAFLREEISSNLRVNLAKQQELSEMLSQLASLTFSNQSEFDHFRRALLNVEFTQLGQIAKIREKTIALETAVLNSETQFGDRFTAFHLNVMQSLSNVEHRLQINESDILSVKNQQISYTSNLETTLQSVKAISLDTNSLKENTCHSIDELKIRLLRTERCIKSLLSMFKQAKLDEHKADETIENNTIAPATRTVISKNHQQSNFDYYLFEHRFRGSRSDIKERQQIYLTYFHKSGTVLDLGCGRGEFLEIVSNNNIKAIGIDLNIDMIDFCRELGLEATLADISEYLKQVEDNTIDGIFCAQVVEHLTPEKMFEIISLCAQKLKPEAPLIIETINPRCKVAMSNFYIDPSHIRPVLPDMLVYFLEQNYFKINSVIFTSPISGTTSEKILHSKTMNNTIYQDYAVVAYNGQSNYETP